MRFATSLPVLRPSEVEGELGEGEVEVELAEDGEVEVELAEDEEVERAAEGGEVSALVFSMAKRREITAIASKNFIAMAAVSVGKERERESERKKSATVYFLMEKDTNLQHTRGLHISQLIKLFVCSLS